MALFTHVELFSKNPKGAREFYGGVFGWTFDDVPMPGGVYTMIKTAEGEQVGGIVKKKDKAQPESWVGYVTVASVKRTVAKAVRRKAKVLVDYTPVPGMGAYAVLKDPRGGYIGVWEQAKASKKKAAKKKVAGRKKTSKKAAPKKAAPKKAAPKKAAPKKVTKKKASARARR
jgi:uncharacterized protein